MLLLNAIRLSLIQMIKTTQLVLTSRNFFHLLQNIKKQFRLNVGLIWWSQMLKKVIRNQKWVINLWMLRKQHLNQIILFLSNQQVNRIISTKILQKTWWEVAKIYFIKISKIKKKKINKFHSQIFRFN